MLLCQSVKSIDCYGNFNFKNTGVVTETLKHLTNKGLQ